MGSVRLYQGVDLRSVANANEWELIRGPHQSLNLATQFAGRSGWSLASDAPSELSISSAGNITGQFDFNSDFSDNELLIATNQGEILVPLAVRDYFPDDFNLDITTFYSAFRSFDNSARELWVGTYMYPDSSDALSQTMEITVSSEADGYLDLDALVAELVAISNNGILRVDTLRDQVGMLDLMAVDDSEFLAVHIQDGAISDNTIRENGRLGLLSGWQPSDFDSNWAGANRNQVSYFHSGGSFVADGWGIVVVFRLYDDSGDTWMRIGDSNSFPGVRYVGSNPGNPSNNYPYQHNTIGSRPDNLSIPSADVENPWMWMGYHRRVSNTIYRDGHELYRLDSEQDLSANRNDTEHHSGGGVHLTLGDYHWWELQAYSFNHDAGDASLWANNRALLPDNLVGLIGDETHRYA